MKKSSHLSSHEIIGGHSFLSEELDKPSGIFAGDSPQAPELTNREAAHFLISTLSGNTDQSKDESTGEASVTSIYPDEEYVSDLKGKSVSQFIGNLIDGHKPPSPYAEFQPIDRQNHGSADGSAA